MKIEVDIDEKAIVAGFVSSDFGLCNDKGGCHMAYLHPLIFQNPSKPIGDPLGVGLVWELKELEYYGIKDAVVTKINLQDEIMSYFLDEPESYQDHMKILSKALRNFACEIDKLITADGLENSHQ